MAVMIGGLSQITPLTTEVFGPDGKTVLEGRLAMFGEGLTETMGICFIPKGYSPTQPIFSHPTLFSQLPWDINASYDVKMYLEDGFIVLDILPMGLPGIDPSPRRAEPVTMSNITLEHAAELIARTKYTDRLFGTVCCRGDKCIREKKHYRDYRSMALVVIGHETEVMCKECYEALAQENPEMEKTSLALGAQRDELHDLQHREIPLPLVLGWELPPHTPVPIWNNPAVTSYRKV